MLGRNPDLRVLGCSHTATLASDMNRDVQKIIDHDAYRALYPETTLCSRNVRTLAGSLPLRNSDTFEIVGHRGLYHGAGVGAAIVGKGYDVMLLDDLLSGREAADSPTQRENVWKWFTGDCYTRRGGKDTRIALITTRWHPEDPAGKLLTLAAENRTADQWHVLSLAAVRELEDCHPEDPRAEGEALWPERYPLSELMKTKAANPYDWLSQYQQRPIAQGSVEWPESHFNYPGFWFDEWPENTILRVMALDPSKGSQDKVGDYQALILWGMTPDGTEWVEADLGRRPMTATHGPGGMALSEGMV